MKTPTTIYVDNHYSITFDSKADAKRWQAEQAEIEKRNDETIKKLYAWKIKIK